MRCGPNDDDDGHEGADSSDDPRHGGEEVARFDA
jgi:hypothetical protein